MLMGGGKIPPECRTVKKKPMLNRIVFLDEIPQASEDAIRAALRTLSVVALATMLTACEKTVLSEEDASGTRLHFVPTTADTRGTVTVGDYFSRLAVQLFDVDGNKVFSQSKTQTRDDDDFGTLSVGLTAGTYTVVAVGHSSPVTPTIKSTELVQFTAKDGVKNSDTFCHCGQVTVSEDGGYHELKMNRVTAMITFEFMDAAMPEGFAGLKVEYTGGSANFAPRTGQGCTKSSQSEMRQRAQQYQVFTFPYLSAEGALKITVSALDAGGNVLTTRTLTDVPVTRNRITRCTGVLFGEGDFDIKQVGFGITVKTDWDGINEYTF